MLFTRHPPDPYGLMKVFRRLHALAVREPTSMKFRERIGLRLGGSWFESVMAREFGGMIDLAARIGVDPQFGHGFFGVFISGHASIGDRVIIYQHVTIGADARNQAPVIGNDVFIGANATLIGRCVIGDGAKIGAGVTLVDAVIPPGAVIVNKSAFNLTEGTPIYPEVDRLPSALLVS